MFCAFDRVATDAHSSGLAQPQIGGLFHRLIGQRARAGQNPTGTTHVNMAGHDADFAGIRRDNSGAVGADQAAFATFQRTFDTHHIQHGNTFGDRNDHLHFGVNRFQNTVGGKGRRHIDDGGVGLCHVFRLVYGIEHRQIQMGLPTLARRHTANHLGAIGNGLFRVKGTLRAGEALTDYLGVFVDEDCHLCGLSLLVFLFHFALTSFANASSVVRFCSIFIMFVKPLFCAATLTRLGQWRARGITPLPPSRSFRHRLSGCQRQSRLRRNC